MDTSHGQEAQQGRREEKEDVCHAPWQNRPWVRIGRMGCGCLNLSK